MKPDFFTMDDFDLGGRTVLVRVDLNSPLHPETGEFLDDTRVRLHLPTLEELRHAKVVLLAHQSRPGKGDYTTLEEHAKVVTRLLKRDVTYIDALLGSRAKGAVNDLKEGQLVLLENVRFYAEEVTLKDCAFEKQAKSHLVKGLASLCQYFVQDAFAAAHRCQPSLTGFTHLMPSCAGRLMEKEIIALSKAMHTKKRPRVVILGGAKFDDSIAMATNMLENDLADHILTGGAVANFYLHASGVDIGGPALDFLKKEASDKFDSLTNKAKSQLDKFKDNISLPQDVAVNEDGKRRNMKVHELPTKHNISDIGLDTIVSYTKALSKATTVIVNGPMGVFEVDEFAMGTEGVFHAVADSPAYKVVGGGHTSATFENMGLAKKVDHISSGGGACLTFLAGGDMPGIRSLVENKKKFAGCKLP
jgi:phosphoglycerate kinase